MRAIAAPKNPLPSEAASANTTRFSFIAYGDTRGRRDGKDEQYEHSLVMDSILATTKKLESTPFPVRFVIMTGDAVVSGRDPRQWNASFVSIIERATQGAGLPYFPSPGNHDVGIVDWESQAPNRNAGLKNYLAAMSDLVPREGTVRRLRGYPTYAFGYGNAFFIALDSNISTDDQQFDFVRAQLEGLDRRRYKQVVAFFHHPAFSSGPHGGSRVGAATAGLRTKYMPLFRKHHVSLLLTGHEHVYEHWVERYEDAGRRYRIDQIVTGGGGAPLYTFQGKPDLREYLTAGRSEKVAVQQLVRPGPEPGDNPYHYVIVQVDGDRLRVEVIGVDWGAGYQPYRSRGVALYDDVPPGTVTPETPR